MSTVAVYGLNGTLGADVIKALISEPFVSKIKTPIKLLTQSPDQKVVTSDKVEYINVKETPLKQALQGIDVFINLGNFPTAASPEVIEALVANNVKLYIPSQFGTDLEALQDDFPGFLDGKNAHSNEARSKGIKTVDIYTGLFIGADQIFYGPSPFSVLNFDADKKEVEIVGDENTVINPSFFKDIGNVVAALATRDDYKSIPDKVRTYSGKVTLGDLVAHYEKKHNVKITKKYIKPSEVIAEAKEKYKNFSFQDFFLYLRAFLAGGEGKGLIFESKNDRELINPGESLFKWTKYTI